MREPTFFTLAALLDGPLHGYGVIKRAEELSGGRVRMAAGTLYAALERLDAEGLVRIVEERVVSGRPRRYYELTPEGKVALETAAERMAQAARLVTSRRVKRVRLA